MARDLPHVTRRCDEFFQPLFLEPQDGPRLLDGGDRHGEADGALKVAGRRQVSPWGLGAALGDAIADLCYGSGEGRIGKHG